MKSIRVGVDGGGTTTRAVLIDENLKALGRGEAPSSNHYSVGQERALQNIERAVMAALVQAGLTPDDITSWGLGLAGACSATEQDLLGGALKGITRGRALKVDEDVAAAWAGSYGGEPGVVCIAGTGANCFGVGADGRRARVDGLGPVLGDRGSGYWIGEMALRAVCAAVDGAAPATELVEPVLKQFKAATLDELVTIIYRPDFERSRIAALLPVVLDAATYDGVAGWILQRAGAELAHSAASVLKKLNLDSVAVTGGVLTHAAPVRAAFEEELAREFPGVTIVHPLYDATIGAALLAPLP